MGRIEDIWSKDCLEFKPERQGLSFHSNEDDRSCCTLELADSDFLEELPLVHQVTLNPPSSSSS
ncbi:hypothetical protein CUMW_266670 [Citrus unshiu]|uniref:Uncharacterized protein n=1 Tax=Citrus unshiu TaxID=55188 RepID=A0A2H5QW03_CITUN|nr:hypothetical protein CUMW_266670 [Citrus unshiu]